MKVGLRSTSSLSVIFVGRPELELQTPSTCEWAKTHFVGVGTEWDPAIEAIKDIAAAVCIIFDPYSLTAAQLAQAPGLKIGVLTHIPSAEEVERLRSLVSDRGFRWFTSPDPGPKEVQGLPILQTLPPLVDAARLPKSPNWAARGHRILAPTAAPIVGLEKLELLPSTSDPWAALKALKDSAVMLCVAGSRDLLRLLSLSLGHLVICEEELPLHWGFEVEEEYLLYARERWKEILAQLGNAPNSFRAIRIRAWQKARELFDASGAFRRLVHDALWLSTS